MKTLVEVSFPPFFIPFIEIIGPTLANTHEYPESQVARLKEVTGKLVEEAFPQLKISQVDILDKELFPFLLEKELASSINQCLLHCVMWTVYNPKPDSLSAAACISTAGLPFAYALEGRTREDSFYVRDLDVTGKTQVYDTYREFMNFRHSCLCFRAELDLQDEEGEEWKQGG